MGEQDDGKWDLPYSAEFEDAVLRALGSLLVQTDMLEHALTDLYRIVNAREWDEVYEKVRPLMLGQICALAIAEYEARFPSGEFRERLEAMKPALKKAVDTRNEFVHASWSFDHKRELLHRRRLPRGQVGVRELRKLTVSDVEAAVEILGDTAEKVWEELYDPVEVATRTPQPPIPGAPGA